MLRPQEVRFLVRIRFKNGATFRQIATMKPPSSAKYNSDFIFQDDPEDPWELDDATKYDDEGFKEGEQEYDASEKLTRERMLKDLQDKGWDEASIKLYAPGLLTQ